MATVAARAPKRDLAPDWRDALREAVRRFAVRTWGGMLIVVGVAGAVTLGSHNPTDPSLSTAAGGPPANWLGPVGAYFSDALLLFFGLGAALFMPVIALAGLRMVRLQPARRIGRGLLLAAVGAVLFGIALSLTSESAVSGLPAGWGGALGLAPGPSLDAPIRPLRQPPTPRPPRRRPRVLSRVGGCPPGGFGCLFISLAFQIRGRGAGGGGASPPPPGGAPPPRAGGGRRRTAPPPPLRQGRGPPSPLPN